MNLYAKFYDKSDDFEEYAILPIVAWEREGDCLVPYVMIVHSTLPITAHPLDSERTKKLYGKFVEIIDETMLHDEIKQLRNWSKESDNRNLYTYPKLNTDNTTNKDFNFGFAGKPTMTEAEIQELAKFQRYPKPSTT